MGHSIIDVSCVIIFVGKAWKATELVEDAAISGLLSQGLCKVINGHKNEDAFFPSEQSCSNHIEKHFAVFLSHSLALKLRENQPPSNFLSKPNQVNVVIYLCCCTATMSRE